MSQVSASTFFGHYLVNHINTFVFKLYSFTTIKKQHENTLDDKDEKLCCVSLMLPI